jgi:hypothetical protein
MKNKYSLDPKIVHTNKNAAEIKAMQVVWPKAKHQLCLWHLKKAVCSRLSKAKLSTVHYDPHTARQEFPFIDISFRPSGLADPCEAETKSLDINLEDTALPPQDPNALRIHIPVSSQAVSSADSFASSATPAAPSGPSTASVGQAVAGPARAPTPEDLVSRNETSPVSEAQGESLLIQLLQLKHKLLSENWCTGTGTMASQKGKGKLDAKGMLLVSCLVGYR